mgnify:CR=1 FL=1
MKQCITFLTALLLFCVHSQVHAQTATQISDPGKIYSTFNLSNYKARLEQQFGTTKAAEMIKYGREEAWPEGLNTFDKRMEDPSQEALKKYKVRTIVALTGTQVMVSVSPSDNSYMSSRYLLGGQTFYIVIGKEGLKNASAPPLKEAVATESDATNRVNKLLQSR